MTPAIDFEGGSLRPWALADSERLVQAWNDLEIARWNQVPVPADAATADRWIAGWQRRYDRLLAVDLVIVDQSSVVVGEVGLSNFADIPGGGRGALVGYWLLPEARGSGMASRALQAIDAWSRAELGVTVLCARCDAENPASQSVAARAGFTHERNDPSGTQLWFSRPRDD